MNPQSYRRKLEAAVERRDQAALAELEQLAPENPTTAEIWRLHQQLEGAIDHWREPAAPSPRLEPAPRSVRGRTTRWIQVSLAASCLFLVYRSLVPELSFWDTEATSQQMATSEDASWLSRWHSFATDEPDAQLPPGLPDSVDSTEASIASGHRREIATVVDNSGTEEAAGDIAAASTLANTPLVTYSLALADRSQQLLSPGLLPALPNVSLQLGQGIHATWDTLSSWPREMQDAWRTFQTPSEGDPEWTPESDQEERQPPLRRFRGRRTFSWGSSAAGADRFLA